MKKNKTYWIWYWGIDEEREDVHSKPKRFYDFDKMKKYSSNHSYKHIWIKGYWSNYEKITP